MSRGRAPNVSTKSTMGKLQSHKSRWPSLTLTVKHVTSAWASRNAEKQFHAFIATPRLKKKHEIFSPHVSAEQFGKMGLCPHTGKPQSWMKRIFSSQKIRLCVWVRGDEKGNRQKENASSLFWLEFRLRLQVGKFCVLLGVFWTSKAATQEMIGKSSLSSDRPLSRGRENIQLYTRWTGGLREIVLWAQWKSPSISNWASPTLWVKGDPVNGARWQHSNNATLLHHGHQGSLSIWTGHVCILHALNGGEWQFLVGLNFTTWSRYREEEPDGKMLSFT